MLHPRAYIHSFRLCPKIIREFLNEDFLEGAFTSDEI